MGILQQWKEILASVISNWKGLLSSGLNRANNSIGAIKHCIGLDSDSNTILRRSLTVSLQFGGDITNVSYLKHSPGTVEKETRLKHHSGRLDCSTIQQPQPETDLGKIGLKFLTCQSQDVAEPSAIDVSPHATVEGQPIDGKHDSDRKSNSELSHGLTASLPDKIHIRVSDMDSGDNVRTTDEGSSTKLQAGEPSETQQIKPAKSSEAFTRSRDQNEDSVKAATKKQRETPPPSDHDNKKYLPTTITSSKQEELMSRMTLLKQQESPRFSSSTFYSRQDHIKQEDGFDTGHHQEVGERCFICDNDLAKSPVSNQFKLEFHNFPDVAVLPCNHVFHMQCLEFAVSEEQMKDPPCILCLSQL